MVSIKLLVYSLPLLVSPALAGRIKYEVRMQRPDYSRASRSRTINLPDRHLDLVSENMRTWSGNKFGARIGGDGHMVVVTNTAAIAYNEDAAEAMIAEMAVVVLCNIPGAPPAADEGSTTAFNRDRDCKKRMGRKGVRLEA